MKPKLPKIIEYTLLSLVFSLPAAWLALYAVCYNDWLPAACRRPLDSFVLLTILVVILTLGPIGWSYHERALSSGCFWDQVMEKGLIRKRSILEMEIRRYCEKNYCHRYGIFNTPEGIRCYLHALEFLYNQINETQTPQDN